MEPEDPVSRDILEKTEAALSGDREAAITMIKMFRDSIGSAVNKNGGLMKGSNGPIVNLHPETALYFFHCFNKFLNGTNIDDALNLTRPRGKPISPETKFNQTKWGADVIEEMGFDDDAFTVNADEFQIIVQKKKQISKKQISLDVAAEIVAKRHGLNESTVRNAYCRHLRQVWNEYFDRCIAKELGWIKDPDEISRE
jgi:hypothetical protein